ncbi:hypothetical protein BGX38DRAFT_1292153, partial [Terfezia claveryi]
KEQDKGREREKVQSIGLVGEGQQTRKKIVKTGLAPIKAMEGLQGFDLAEYMKGMVIEIRLPQLLQGSPSLRRQLVLLLTTTNSRAKKMTRTTRAAGALAKHEGVTEAPELEETVEAMFIEVFVGKENIEEEEQKDSKDIEEVDKAIAELLDELEEWEYEEDIKGEEDDTETGKEREQ